MRFPMKPQCLNLTPLEGRFIFPRIPFMQIRVLSRGRHLVMACCFNVPADVNSTVSAFSRPINELQTIPMRPKTKVELQASLSISEC